MTTTAPAAVPRGVTIFTHGEDVPARRIRTPMWLRAAGYWAYQYRRTWRSSVVTSFLIPVLYLAAMGIALGSLIDKHSHGVDGATYVAYLAPGLLAGTCMQIGTNDATYPVMGGIKWMRTYFAQLASPLEVYDVLLGHLAWIAARLAIVVSIYLAVMADDAEGWEQVECVQYNERVTKTIKTFLATWRPAGGVIRVVLVKEEDGWVAFFATKGEVTAVEILEGMADRGSLDDKPAFIERATRNREHPAPKVANAP